MTFNTRNFLFSCKVLAWLSYLLIVFFSTGGGSKLRKKKSEPTMDPQTRYVSLCSYGLYSVFGYDCYPNRQVYSPVLQQ